MSTQLVKHSLKQKRIAGMGYKSLRKEFDLPSFRECMKNSLQDSCVNCGNKENLEYHHIVPLKLGGTNKLSNIVALCPMCHKAAHRGQHISKYSNHTYTGRKSIASIDRHSKVFDMYINGEIGNRKCIELTGYSTRTPIKDRPVFKQYLKSKGIQSVRNLIDIAATSRKRGLLSGDEVGEIVYQDGRIEKMTYKDTGVNDIDYVRRKQL